MRRARSGFTLLELLLVVAVVGALALAYQAWQPQQVARFARQLTLELNLTRWRAVTQGQTLALMHTPCAGAHHTHPPSLDAAFFASFPARGLMFTPLGFPRSCDGGGVGNATITLASGTQRARVIVSSLGRVRWEP